MYMYLQILPAAAHYSFLIICGALTEITCCTHWDFNLYTWVFVKISDFLWVAGIWFHAPLGCLCIRGNVGMKVSKSIAYGWKACSDKIHFLNDGTNGPSLHKSPVIPSFTSRSPFTFPLDQTGSKWRGYGRGSLSGDKMGVFDFNHS